MYCISTKLPWYLKHDLVLWEGSRKRWLYDSLVCAYMTLVQKYDNFYCGHKDGDKVSPALTIVVLTGVLDSPTWDICIAPPWSGVRFPSASSVCGVCMFSTFPLGILASTSSTKSRVVGWVAYPNVWIVTSNVPRMALPYSCIHSTSVEYNPKLGPLIVTNV